MPRTHGDGLIHTRRFTHMVNHEEQLVQINYEAKTGPEELKIGQYVAELIEEGSTFPSVRVLTHRNFHLS